VSILLRESDGCGAVTVSRARGASNPSSAMTVRSNIVTPFSSVLARFGGRILNFLEVTGRFFAFSVRSCGMVFSPPFRLHHFSEQMMDIGVKSLPIANLTALFVGMVMVLQTGYQLQQFGAKLYSAGITAIALTREMVPVFTAVVVGARVASSIAAELGTMKVTEQIDAMDALAVNPIKYLVVPRLIASTIMLPVLTLYANLIGFLGGMLVGVLSLNISVRLYYNYTLQFLTLSDLYSGIIKTFFFGAIVGLVGCFSGFETRGGAEGVGRSTTSAVVVTLVLILIWDFILANWILFLTGELT
jgi:phospholipid/cholesterol/gamma-HCH transport system permease protein